MKKNVKPTIVNHLAKKFAGILNSKIVLDEKDRIIVAVSGGPDSVALLFLLKELPKKIAVSAVYVDHGLRPGEIPQEIELIERHCIELDYPFYVRQVDVKGRYQSTGESPEAAARILRYEILEEIRHELHAKYIAVGHTADDQVEQFFIRLIRGTGRDGLSGMDYQNGFIIRPLLDETKKSLVAYLDARGVKYCTDSSNKERNFLRNRVRLDLLPLLEKEFTPAIRTKILQLMEIIRVEEAFLAAQTEAALTECVEIAADKKYSSDHNIVQIDCFKFSRLHLAFQRRLLESCLTTAGVSANFAHIEQLLTFISCGKSGKELHLDCGVRATREHNTLLFKKLQVEALRSALPLPSPIHLEIASPGIFLIKESQKNISIEAIPPNQQFDFTHGTLFVDAAKISFPIILRSNQPGDRFTPYGKSGSKKVSRYFNEKKIAARERPHWPVLVSREKIVGIPGLTIDDSCKITSATQKIYKIEIHAQ